MSKVVSLALAAACFSLLSGCKPSLEQLATSDKYANALLAMKVQVQSHDIDASITAASRRFAEACGRHPLLQPAPSAPVCRHLEALRRLDPSVPTQPAAVAVERAAWDAYADEPDQQLLAAALTQDIET